MNEGSQQGRVVAVTGSSSGIGAATAHAFADAGASVLVNSARSVAEGEAVAASLSDALYVQGDITDADVPERLVAAALDRWGRLDTLVNNAGTTALIPHQDLEAASVDVWRRIFEVNVFGTWAMSVAAMPALRESHGSIVNVASVAGLRASPGIGLYGVSKAALIRLTMELAAELCPRIRVNAVAPAVVKTKFATALYEGREEQVSAAYPLRRLGMPRDIAGAVAFLLSDDAAWITGQTLVLDGGITLRGGM